MIRRIAASVLLSAFAAAPMVAAAASPIAPVGPNVTVLTATPTLVGAGVSVSALGLASLTSDASGNPVGLFPITGGYLAPDLSNAMVEHMGSGLRLSRNGLDLQNFPIDTTMTVYTIFGSVTSGSTFIPSAPLFTLSGFDLLVSGPGGGALAAFLGIPDLSGAKMGFALTSPVAAVPEPETCALLLAGLGLVTLAALRHTQRI
ncbi:MAG: PEP-CTERM sorting domain-containing protein [Methyloversatilis sp.]|nr:PEP-CTERM sorting domain-containing protein [Methyloversatilis sp.]MBP6193301.1 PEP-CTERM sorting domain-containing protein [Methyloversatilis sp.]MBP9118590.1 PEP-CTERM sorting domain-containing protein [Methyloversatilis sp.]